MKKTVLTFGLISGGISALTMLFTVPFADKIGFDKAEIFGYTVIVLSVLLVFFGVRSYRQNASAGKLTFGQGFAVGILITLLSNVLYVATWEIVYYKFVPDFADKYAAHMIEHSKSSGASKEQIEKMTREANQFKQEYRKPLVNVAYTFAEVFPFGLGAALISAGILRKKSAKTLV